MHDKIRRYVYYFLRFDSSEGNQEKKEEIISNLIDRYDAIYEETHDESYAYIETIKTIGDFVDTKKEKKLETYKPNFAEMFLIASTVLSVFGLIIVLLNAVYGSLVIATSIVFFAVGAVYLYQQSQYVKEHDYDIDKHNYYLTKTFSYVKTNGIFWSIATAYLITMIVYSLMITFAGPITISGDNAIDSIFSIILFFASIFVITFIIILLIFILIYKKSMLKYEKLTGLKSLKSASSIAVDFINDDKNSKIYTKKDPRIIIQIFSVFSIFSSLFFIENIIRIIGDYNSHIVYSNEILTEMYIIPSVASGILALSLITVGVLGFIKVIKKKMFMYIFFFAIVVVTLVGNLLLYQFSFVFAILFLVVICLGMAIFEFIRNRS